MCCTFWEKCLHSHKIGQGCSTSLNEKLIPQQNIFYRVFSLTLPPFFLNLWYCQEICILTLCYVPRVQRKRNLVIVILNNDINVPPGAVGKRCVFVVFKYIHIWTRKVVQKQTNKQTNKKQRIVNSNNGAELTDSREVRKIINLCILVLLRKDVKAYQNKCFLFVSYCHVGPENNN